MYQKQCYRCLEKQIAICGLEPDDLFLIVFFSGLVYFFLSGLISVVFGSVLFFTLRRIKEGKPQGYTFYLLYKSGITSYFPSFLRSPNIFKLKGQFDNKIILSPISASDEETNSYVQYWFGGTRIFK